MTTDYRAMCADGTLHINTAEFVLRRARALLAQPEPEGADLHYAWADLHYAWEVHDAAGDWQAGGSANSLEDVQREGNRYLQTYSQDGPHKLIIQRHCVSTIEEVTND
jgi:hypothetical protein